MAKRGPRIRRSRAEAQRVILEAAARHLQAGGPEAVRVQRIAADLGISDAAIHHHFGSRRGLLEALLRLAGRRLRERIASILEGWNGEPPGLRPVAEAIADIYATQGFARLALWLALSGTPARGAGMFEPLVDAVHDARAQLARKRGGPRPRRRDTRYRVALLNVALAAEPIFGPGFLRSVGLEGEGPDEEAFRVWLVRRLSDLLTEERAG